MNSGSHGGTLRGFAFCAVVPSSFVSISYGEVCETGPFGPIQGPWVSVATLCFYRFLLGAPPS